MFLISNSYELASLPLGDYYLLEKEPLSRNRAEKIEYLILDNEKTPILIADCTIPARELYSIVLATVNVFRPVAQIARLNDDTFAVHVSDHVGTIEKTDGWHYRDKNNYVRLGMTSKINDPPHHLLNILNFLVTLEPLDEGRATKYRFWQCGTDEPIAIFYADINNLEITASDSVLTPYICFFLVLINQLTVNK